MGQVSLCCLGQVNVPINPTPLKWGGTTLLVASFVLALFAIGGYLAANHLLPGSMAWMDVGTLGNAMLLTGTVVAFVLGVSAWLLSRQKKESLEVENGDQEYYYPAPKGNGHYGTSMLPIYSQPMGTPYNHASPSNMLPQPSGIQPAQPILPIQQNPKALGFTKGQVIMQFAPPSNVKFDVRRNCFILGNPKKGQSPKDFYDAIDSWMGYKLRLTSGFEWRNPGIVFIRCLVSVPSNLVSQVIDLPFFLFENKHEGDSIEFILNGIPYSLKINHRKLQEDTEYYRANFNKTYKSVLARIKEGNLQTALFDQQLISYKEWCDDKDFLKGFHIQNPSVPHCNLIKAKDHFTIQFKYHFANQIRTVNNGKFLAVHATEPVSPYHPSTSEYLLVFSLPEGASEKSVTMKGNGWGTFEITVTPPEGKMHEWLDHFSTEQKQLWKRWGET